MAGHYGGIPGLAGIPAARPREHNFARLGEQTISAKLLFTPGTHLNYGTAWRWEIRESVGLDVRAVMWEVFAEPEDLDALLWNSEWKWDFVQTTMPISHLNRSTGSLGDHFFPEDLGDLEKLADCGSKAPSEEMWRALTQTMSAGQNLCFRGRKVYMQMPVHIPPNTDCAICLVLDESIKIVGKVRIRVALDCVFKKIIEFG